MKGVVQDRTIYEDVEIFSKNLHEMGFMDDRDWETYKQLFRNMTKFLKVPDLIVYLRADFETLVKRIETRSRKYEANMILTSSSVIVLLLRTPRACPSFPPG